MWLSCLWEIQFLKPAYLWFGWAYRSEENCCLLEVELILKQQDTHSEYDPPYSLRLQYCHCLQRGQTLSKERRAQLNANSCSAPPLNWAGFSWQGTVCTLSPHLNQLGYLAVTLSIFRHAIISLKIAPYLQFQVYTFRYTTIIKQSPALQYTTAPANASPYDKAY